MKIGIANDSPTALEAIRRVIASSAQHQVVWMARNGVEAVAKCSKDAPDLVLMDLLMPEMDGVEATRKIMAQSPCPILIVTASVDGNSSKVFAALSAGALDATKTPTMAQGTQAAGVPLLAKIDQINRRVFEASKVRHPAGRGDSGAGKWLLAIGASAGGPAALVELLQQLPKDFPASVVIIQHIDQEFAEPLAEWLDSKSLLPVRVAKSGDSPEPGHILLARTNDHLVFQTPTTLTYTAEPVELSYRPSVDVFFQSAVRRWQGKAIGVLLTGMGRDGAKGLKAMRGKGWHTVAQDRGSSVLYGMPKAAAELNAAVEILPLSKIAPAITKFILSAT